VCRQLWLFAGADEDRNIATHGGKQSGRMQDFRAKGRHFRRFFKSDNVNTFGRWRDARIGSIDTRNIGPDIDAGGV
jgi:hypothetical protein